MLLSLGSVLTLKPMALCEKEKKEHRGPTSPRCTKTFSVYLKKMPLKMRNNGETET